MKLKNLLIVVFVVIAGVPLFVGLQSLNHYTGEHYRRQVEEHLGSLSLIAKKRVLDIVERVEDNTALVASRTQMRLSLARWLESGDSKEIEVIQRILNDARNGLRHLKGVGVFDSQGRLVASSTELSPPLTQLSADISRQFSAGFLVGRGASPQRLKTALLRLEPEQDQVLLISIAPLILENRRIGYVRLAFYTEFLADLVRDRTGLGATGEWLFTIRHESGDAQFAIPLKYDPQAAFKRRVAKDRLDVPVTQALLGNEVIMRNAPDYRETPVLASTRYIADLDWGLVAKMNEEEVNRLVNQNRVYIYLSEFVIVFVAILAGILLSIYIAGPIEKLRAHTSKVASGRFEQPPRAGGWQEVKELSKNFSYMILALKDLNENLQQKVEERTQELNLVNRQLELLATLDPLTGLHNRRYFSDRLDQELSRAHRYDGSLALVMMDIDLFKAVNDAHGHLTGDEVLKGIAHFLAAEIRETDVVARIGGEEFCLVLPECNKASALTFLERLRADISAMKFRSDGAEFTISCSFGIAFMDDSEPDANTLMTRADQALYQAKEQGRNRVMIYLSDGRVVPVNEFQEGT
ncbi:sensor domain-containing diguanylate cyclase [Marinobacter sp. SS21]|uniref:sensor domain-containing diguanylate cyclase n=1 Tax=Marinobacter sp. SS21 TaxID=2979460 RepID=UPI00232FC0E6|nr:diguanylate cyclase [Marinobacter sp. SS21]MDC0663412.1 diguanylate cyclase [Marinobacter sp. SS21]